MCKNPHVFKLEKGAEVEVPLWMFATRAIKPDAEGGLTPMITRIKSVGGGRFTFRAMSELGSRDVDLSGIVGFIPRFAPGDVIVIDRVEVGGSARGIRNIRFLPKGVAHKASLVLPKSGGGCSCGFPGACGGTCECNR